MAINMAATKQGTGQGLDKDRARLLHGLHVNEANIASYNSFCFQWGPCFHSIVRGEILWDGINYMGWN